MAECSNFWSKLDRSKDIVFMYKDRHYESPNLVRVDFRGQTQNDQCQKGQQSGNSERCKFRSVNQDRVLYREVIKPLRKNGQLDLDLSATLCGRLYEDINQSYIWKTKWGLPPTIVKLGSPGSQPTDKLFFEMFLVEANDIENCFLVIPEGIKGSMRKIINNNFCEFKGLKLNCTNQGQKRRMLILAYEIDQAEPFSRYYLDSFLSPEIQVFSENGKVMQVEKMSQLKQYFEVFDPDVFQKTVRRSEGDLEHFYSYTLKKNPKIKNLLYLAYKFPEVVSLYANRKYLKIQKPENPFENFCELFFSVDSIHEDNHLILVSNYLNEDCKIAVRLSCPSDQMKFIINKDFTSFLSVLVGDKVPLNEQNFIRVKTDIKPLYTKYYRSIVQDDSEPEQEYTSAEQSQQQASLYEQLEVEENGLNAIKGSSQQRKQVEVNQNVDESTKQKKLLGRKLKKTGSRDQQESAYEGEENNEDGSEADVSGKRPRKTPPNKLVDRNKKTVIKNKIQEKQEERHRNLEKQPQFIQIPIMNGLANQRLPGQPGMPMVLIPDGKGGFQPHMTQIPGAFVGQPQFGGMLQHGRMMVGAPVGSSDKEQPKVSQVHVVGAPGPSMMFPPTAQQMFLPGQGFMQSPIMALPGMPQGMIQSPMIMGYPGMPQMGQLPQVSSVQAVSRLSSMQTIPSMSSIPAFSIPTDFNKVIQPQMFVFPTHQTDSQANKSQTRSQSCGVETRNQRNRHEREKSKEKQRVYPFQEMLPQFAIRPQMMAPQPTQNIYAMPPNPMMPQPYPFMGFMKPSDR